MAARARRRIDANHDCKWRDRVEAAEQRAAAAELRVAAAEVALAELKTAFEQLRAEMESMKRRLLGPKSEKMPPIGREVRAKVGVDPAAAQETPRANAKLRSARVVDDRCEHKVPDDQRTCPKCGRADKLKPVGKGIVTDASNEHPKLRWMNVETSRLDASPGRPLLRPLRSRPRLAERAGVRLAFPRQEGLLLPQPLVVLGDQNLMPILHARLNYLDAVLCQKPIERIARDPGA